MKSFITESEGIYYVVVQEYKYNRFRDDFYWVTNLVKTYKNESDAIKFAQRFQ